jgi:NTE family protein
MSIASGNTREIMDDPGPALCLSGGGFRATIFHLGALRRLNELGVLSRIRACISVSGGSILNGILASRWNSLTADTNGRYSNFHEVIEVPTLDFCSKDLRTSLLLFTRLNWLNWSALLRDGFAISGNYLADKYESLLQKKTLAQSCGPGSTTPRFVFCATSFQTGACWQFHCGPDAKMGDFYTGYCPVGDTRLSEAVAASSAFPPGFGALRLKPGKDLPFTRIDQWGTTRTVSSKRAQIPAEVRREILLTDGGVYDNLGVEPIWNRCKTILVSDAGRPFSTIASLRQWAFPRMKRCIDISIEQVAAVRKRWLMEHLVSGQRKGAVWTLGTLLTDYPVKHDESYETRVLDSLQQIRTDLNAFTEGERACLVNHGYALADAAIRSYAPEISASGDITFSWPMPEWRNDDRAATALCNSSKRQILRDLRMMLRGE